MISMVLFTGFLPMNNVSDTVLSMRATFLYPAKSSGRNPRPLRIT